MLDPIGGFQRIRDLYITYLETAFRIQDPHVSAERRALLESNASLCTEPFVEPIPRYAACDWLLHEIIAVNPGNHLSGFNAEQRRAFVELTLSGLFDAVPQLDPANPSRLAAEYSLYEHQAQMLARGIEAGRPGIVTSGTGSGKTEAFLLPVFAMLAKEATQWAAPQQHYLQKRWWQIRDAATNQLAPLCSWGQFPSGDRPSARYPDRTPFRPQRIGEHACRPKAVRALVLYPMNALVEDQLVRIRIALDSDEARKTCHEHFNGNRIFFGRYTSVTPVTGFDRHPRVSPGTDLERRKRKQQQLFEEMRDLERTQNVARGMTSSRLQDHPRFQFPAVDGAEMVSRWDMQSDPPDLLVTNVSMLSAMLVREVDAPIFEKTRRWLHENDDSYFFLVLDELHLQRGSAGTEVSCLLRLLFHRLGLADPAHRHKLRILASSASLPIEGEERIDSLDYLWDAFGKHGTYANGADKGAVSRNFWSTCIVPGQAIPEEPLRDHQLNPKAFCEFLQAGHASKNTTAEVEHLFTAKTEWDNLAFELNTSSITGRDEDIRRFVIQETAKRLAKACWSDKDKRSRATSQSVLASRLFGKSDATAIEAVRGLLAVRGTGDRWKEWYSGCEPLKAPSFRVHTFFRSIEGLFSSADPTAGVAKEFQSDTRIVGRLDVERDVKLEKAMKQPKRRLELLYCECCGDLLFGGRRSQGEYESPELLPTDPKLDGLPDSATSQLFEELSYDDFAIFWPSTRAPINPAGSHWLPALLNSTTGQVLRATPTNANNAGFVIGYLFSRNDLRDKHRRTRSDTGTAVPYECPSCGEDYVFRQRPHRLSPIRNFRAGFGKTTQLLATELFELLKNESPNEPKLVSFSDSRQDAARAALDIERRHHEDIRRQMVVATARNVLSGRQSIGVIDEQIGTLQEQCSSAVANNDWEKVTKLSQKISELQSRRSAPPDPIVPISALVECIGENFVGPRPSRIPLRPLMKEFAKLGVHPTDPTGMKRFKYDKEDKTYYLPWERLFHLAVDPNAIDWFDASRDQLQNQFDEHRKRMAKDARRLVTEVVFSKTYFALEETGLGFPCVSRIQKDEVLFNKLNAFLRTLGDTYRYEESPWGGSPKGWQSPRDVYGRVKRLGNSLWPDQHEFDTNMNDLLQRLATEGHVDGLISDSRVSIYIVDPDSPFWRCPRCQRSHLHRGVGVCTRCMESLPEKQSGTAAELRSRSFLAKRIDRPRASMFRLHCEELTGQTDHPAERQRRFRGILLPADAQDADTSTSPYAQKEVIDLLAVTTTMEVGIDIGPLQAVFQANMPPQRFNYQQRVGRAGRRGQAFSLVLTVCRSKSHDLHYFRHPEMITGDNPPPPFLTKREPTAPRRFVRKAWLCEAFSKLRREAQEMGTPWPGDEMRPPDIHGEFMQTNDFYSPGSDWPERLKKALTATVDYRDTVASVLAADTVLDAEDLLHCELPDGSRSELSPTLIVQEIMSIREDVADVRQSGLAHSLAEAGFFPMYGMPTRVRDLYLGPRSTKKDDFEWSTIDRDIDLAIYEHAPGSMMVKDKQQHLCVGFTGPLMKTFRFGNRRSPLHVTPMTPAFGASFWMVSCTECGAWQRFDSRAELAKDLDCTCGAILETEEVFECRTPNGARTDFRARDITEQAPMMGRYRSICAEATVIELRTPEEGTNLGIDVRHQARTYRLNRGPRNENFPLGAGFTVVNGEWKLGNFTSLEDQCIANDADGNLFLDSTVQSKFTPDGSGASEPFWLAAPKTTDALFIAPYAIRDGLRLNQVGSTTALRNSNASTAVRSAAISATYLLVNRAALELDIDPAEFDVIEPRTYQLHGVAVPLLQITDHLINGAGFCEKLGRFDVGRNGTLVSRLVNSMVHDRDQYPLFDFLSDDHPTECDQACYKCLHRYGNQMYHGLLDWRLGLCFLKCLVDAKFDCGLEIAENFNEPYLSDWKYTATRLAEEMVVRFGGNASRDVLRSTPIPAFKLGSGSNDWVIVCHPLWSQVEIRGIVAETFQDLQSFGGQIAFTDTFELARRQVKVYQELKEKLSF